MDLLNQIHCGLSMICSVFRRVISSAGQFLHLPLSVVVLFTTMLYGQEGTPLSLQKRVEAADQFLTLPEGYCEGELTIQKGKTWNQFRMVLIQGKGVRLYEIYKRRTELMGRLLFLQRGGEAYYFDSKRNLMNTIPSQDLSEDFFQSGFSFQDLSGYGWESNYQMDGFRKLADERLRIRLSAPERRSLSRVELVVEENGSRPLLVDHYNSEGVMVRTLFYYYGGGFRLPGAKESPTFPVRMESFRIVDSRVSRLSLIDCRPGAVEESRFDPTRLDR